MSELRGLSASGLEMLQTLVDFPRPGNRGHQISVHPLIERSIFLFVPPLEHKVITASVQTDLPWCRDTGWKRLDPAEPVSFGIFVPCLIRIAFSAFPALPVCSR
jgi:hypothetical protein